MRGIGVMHPVFETPVMSVPIVFIPHLLWCFIPQRRMRSFFIIPSNPVFYLLLSFLKGFKFLSLEQLIPHRALIALNMAIIERLSWWYHLLSNPPSFYNPLKLKRAKLRPVISSNYPGRAVKSEETVKILCNVFTWQRVLYERFKTSFAEYIQHIEYPECSTSC